MFNNNFLNIAGVPSKMESEESPESKSHSIEKAVCKDLQKCIRNLRSKASSSKSTRLKEIYKRDMEDFQDIHELIKDKRCNAACKLWKDLDQDAKDMFKNLCGEESCEYFNNMVSERLDVTEPDVEINEEEQVDEVHYPDVVIENYLPDEIASEVPDECCMPKKMDMPSDIMKDLADHIKSVEKMRDHYEGHDCDRCEDYKSIAKVLNHVKVLLDQGTEDSYNDAVIYANSVISTIQREIPTSVRRFLSLYPMGTSLKQFFDKRNK